MQLIWTVAWPLAPPEVARTVAVPPRPDGAVRTARTPPPWSTAVAGEIVPMAVVRLTEEPGAFVTAVMKEDEPQLRLVGTAETVIVPDAAPVPQVRLTVAVVLTAAPVMVIVTMLDEAATGAV